MRSELNVYVDGFNLYYGALRGTPFRWLNPCALAELALEAHYGDCVSRQLRYFSARVLPTEADPAKPDRQESYFRALRTLPGAQLHLGHFLRTKRSMPLVEAGAQGERRAEVWFTEEKGSDVNLATWLLMDAFREAIDVAVVITNDSDLAEPIRVVTTEFARPVVILNPYRRHPSAKLATVATLVRPINRNALKKCQLPDEIEDSLGRFGRPPTW